MICNNCVFNITKYSGFKYCGKSKWEGEALPGFVDENCSDFLKRTESDKNEVLQDALEKIENWINAYPVKIFPQPSEADFKKAHKVLSENNLSLARISADNMRHVLDGIKVIVTDALGKI